MVYGGKVKKLYRGFSFLPSMVSHWGEVLRYCIFSHLSRSLVFPYFIYFWLVPLEALYYGVY